MEEMNWDNVQTTLVGRTAAVEIRHVHGKTDETLFYEHAWGQIVGADRKKGIQMELKGLREGTTLMLPARLTSFKPASRGLFRMKSTGEEVESPDFIATFKASHTDPKKIDQARKALAERAAAEAPVMAPGSPKPN